MKKKSFIKQFKKDLKNKKKLKDSFYFLFLFLFFFIIIFIILSKTILYTFINFIYGLLSSFLLTHIYHLSSSFLFDSLNKLSVLTIANINYPVVIEFLCTGILEFSLLSAAILASFDSSWKKRIIGVLISAVVVFIFNIFRITITIFIIDKLNLSVANFFHGFLFRLFMVIIVVGVYWYWLYKK